MSLNFVRAYLGDFFTFEMLLVDSRPSTEPFLKVWLFQLKVHHENNGTHNERCSWTGQPRGEDDKSRVVIIVIICGQESQRFITGGHGRLPRLCQ